ncbi:MAG: hypothetical protein QOG15_1011 [Solirubrobacteraceae bacterium]|jgi:hypothetical protein|nr:hypothetical protein [Solirubrobacteraceae bacterium]
MSDAEEHTTDADDQQETPAREQEIPVAEQEIPVAEQEIPADISEEELRAAYEEQLKHIRVDDVLVQTLVSLLNLAARRAGLTGGGADEVDWDQVGQAIDATRALLPTVEPVLGPEAQQVRDALSQLQLAYARSGEAPAPGAGGTPAEPKAAPPKAGDTDSAVSSGRLWVPGR